MNKVDVIVNVYGKPWQTLCTLKSLLKVSGEHIDKIYLIEEKVQPYGDNIVFILKEFDNLIHYIPKEYIFLMPSKGNMNDADNRYTYRYQYGIENSDKKYVFITHNDILYHDDIIGHMLDKIDKCVGIGLIGQCWNCPAFAGGVCDGERHAEYNPTYEEVLKLSQTHRYARSAHHDRLLDRTRPMPLPECRLNEFACIINRNALIDECYPNGDTPLFSTVDSIDTATSWFRSMRLKGYNFKNFDIYKDSTHCYFSRVSDNVEDGYVSGCGTQLDQLKYIKAEAFANKYYKENLL